MSRETRRIFRSSDSKKIKKDFAHFPSNIKSLSKTTSTSDVSHHTKLENVFDVNSGV